ncbi:MAG TPA: antitoxin Xre/MbcA/ParS toxin-binding domain-containing protein [Planctomycetota bacterium]|nr:antitoxin Xre/MbcA/ParS toxin-binding domain-containing protein [Planctomycetota bacterium]
MHARKKSGRVETAGKAGSRLVEGLEALARPISDARAIERLLRDLAMNQEDFSRFIRASAPSVSRWIRGEARPSGKMAEKFGRLRVLLNLLQKALVKGDLKYFFGRPHRALRGHRPIDLLDTDFGFEAVKEVIEGALTGTFS